MKKSEHSQAFLCLQLLILFTRVCVLSKVCIAIASICYHSSWVRSLPEKKYRQSKHRENEHRDDEPDDAADTDVTFSCVGHEIKCHKSLLASCSTHFDAMFGSRFKEAQLDDHLKVMVVVLAFVACYIGSILVF